MDELKKLKSDIRFLFSKKPKKP